MCVLTICILTHKKYGWLKQAIFRLGFFFLPRGVIVNRFRGKLDALIKSFLCECFNVTRYRFNEITFIRENLSYQFG